MLEFVEYALECGSCGNVFSDACIPRMLPCSHSLCSCCLAQAIGAKEKICVFCGKNFTANSVEDLTFNRAFLDVAKQLTSLNLESKKSDKSWLQFIREFCDNPEVQSQSLFIVEVLIGMKDNLVENKGKEGLKELLNDVELKVKKIQQLLQNKERDDKRREIIGYYTVGKKPDPIEKKIVKDVQSPQKITLEELRKLCGRRKRNDEREIWAVKLFQGKQRVSQIRIESRKRISLNYLKEGEIPPNSFVIELDLLMQTSSRRGFVDMRAIPCEMRHQRVSYETYQPRLVIKAVDEGKFSLNLLHMFAGDLGPCFADPITNTEMTEEGNILIMIMYAREELDAMLPELNWGPINNVAKPNSYGRAGEVLVTGPVSGWGDEGEQVEISLHLIKETGSNFKDTRNHRNAIGEVEEGYGDLWRVIDDEFGVVIDDCGLIFSL